MRRQERVWHEDIHVTLGWGLKDYQPGYHKVRVVVRGVARWRIIHAQDATSGYAVVAESTSEAIIDAGLRAVAEVKRRSAHQR